MIRHWINLLILIAVTLGARSPRAQSGEHVETSRITLSEAVVRACASSEVRRHLAGQDTLHITAEFAPQWSVWIVEFFNDDRRITFATVSPEGEVMEAGPGTSDLSDGDAEPERRVQALERELRRARETGNEAEVDEILLLLERWAAGERRVEPRREVQPRDPAESTLPVYSLRVPPEAGLREMLADVTEDIEVEGELEHAGRSYPVEVRLHGASTRYAAKKSYRVRFSEQTPLQRRVTYLKAEPMDHTMQQEKLSCDLFRAAGAWVSDAAYINLFLNGRYEGVYLDIEPIRSPFKQQPGLEPEGTLIRAGTFQHLSGWQGLGELRGNEGSLEELREFLEQVNRVDRGDFEQFVRSHTDWPRLRDYLVLQILCHRSEIEADDYFFYRDPLSKRWSLIPWDHNNGNWAVAPYGNRVEQPSIDLFSQSIQELGWRPNHWFVLPSRIFNHDRLRGEFLKRLEELTRELLLSGRVEALIEHNYRQLRPEYPYDPYRAPWEGSDPFLRSAEDLKTFARHHGQRLLKLIQAASDPPAPSLVINEFVFSADGGWVELLNRGATAIELSRYLLATKTDAGNRAHPLPAATIMGPGELAVIHVPRVGPGQGRASIKEGGSDAMSEIHSNPRFPPFPGFDPNGGFIALVRLTPPREDAEPEDGTETVEDFLFYGPQRAGKSYGRWRGSFGHMKPTPREANSADW